MADTAALPLTRWRRWLLAILGLGLFGTAVDLALLAHYEDAWQFVPFAVIALSLASVVLVVRSGTAWAVRGMQVVMVLVMVCGAVGIVLHYRGNMEFQLESDPSRRGFDLFITVIRAKAPPSLAPANLALLGLIGLTSTLRTNGRER